MTDKAGQKITEGISEEIREEIRQLVQEEAAQYREKMRKEMEQLRREVKDSEAIAHAVALSRYCTEQYNGCDNCAMRYKTYNEDEERDEYRCLLMDDVPEAWEDCMDTWEIPDEDED